MNKPKKSAQQPAKKQVSKDKSVSLQNQNEDKFDPTPYLKKGVNDQEIISMKECFDIFDKDQSGYIDLVEMKELIREMNLETSPDKILELAENLDDDKDHKINFQEFLSLLNFYDFDHENEEQLNKIFSKFSESKEAFTIVDLKRMADYAGEQYSQIQLENMIKYADKDGDNAINFEEFNHVISNEQKKIKKSH